MNILSHLARALYWINPLAWLAASGLRYEGERAADDAVLRAGARASDYADHLLDIVKSVGQPVPKIALAMARSSDFEGRLLAILEPGVPRSRLSRARTALVGAAFVLALVPRTSGFIEGGIALRVIATGFAITIVIGLLGGAYPAFRAARLLPTEAIRHD